MCVCFFATAACLLYLNVNLNVAKFFKFTSLQKQQILSGILGLDASSHPGCFLSVKKYGFMRNKDSDVTLIVPTINISCNLKKKKT